MFLILKKGKIIKMLSVMICTVLVSCLCVFSKENEIVQTSNKSGEKVVVLDPGHGEPDRTEP